MENKSKQSDDKPKFRMLPFCSKRVLKDAIEFLELALIEAQFQYPNGSEKISTLDENILNTEKLRLIMIDCAKPLFSATSFSELLPYKYIYRDMWRSLFIISCKLCAEFEDQFEDLASISSTSGTIFEDPLPPFSTDEAMHEFGFNFGESYDITIEKLVERVVRFGFGHSNIRSPSGFMIVDSFDELT